MLAQLVGIPHLMASLLYGSGLRLMECVRLRVKDVDFAYHQLIVRDAKGAQDRVTILPQSLEEALQRQLAKAKLLHEEDLTCRAMERSISGFTERPTRRNVVGVAVCFPSLKTIS